MSAPRRIVFLTREPVLHQRSGSTTYALGLLRWLQHQGADVTLVCTGARGRSPRLFFRVAEAAPAGVRLRFPGYLRLGQWYLLPYSAKAWARALARWAARHQRLEPVVDALERFYGGQLFTEAWDLTAPGAAEVALARREVEAAGAETVVGNYAFWGPALASMQADGRRTAILMHDLLSARVQRLRGAHLPLDCPPVTEAEEMQWFSGAQTILAAQEAEAAAVRSGIARRVFVTPISVQPRALGEEHVIPGRCLFVGSNILPNQTGLAFLLEAVWPRVRAAVPGATLAVAGSVGQVLSTGAGTAKLETLGVEVCGLVPTLETEYARAAVCLVPLQVGTGIKIKLVEALGFGKAIVSTGVGVEGLEAGVNQAVAVADDPEAFAGAVIQLLGDERLRRLREANALKLAEEQFGSGRVPDPALAEALFGGASQTP